MPSVLNFSNIECLNESASGSLGAGMASFVRADFPAVRGFAVTPLVFSDFLKREEVAVALDLFRSGAESPDESWRTVKAVFARARLSWNHELDILSAFGEIDSAVSITGTSLHGSEAAPVYASGGQDVLEGIKHCWLKWLRTGIGRLGSDMPAVVVREIVDSEASVEIRRKGQELRARAVFGLPEGLHDPMVASDIFEFRPGGELERVETRPQDFQYVMEGHGPSRVGVSPDFREEEKLDRDMLAALDGIMAFVREHPDITSCTVCFVSGRPMLYSAFLMSESPAEPELPPRESSMSLLEPVKSSPVTAPQGPVVATRIFLRADSLADLERVGDTYLDGVVASANARTGITDMAAEAKRRFRISNFILELGADDGWLPDAVRAISENGIQPGILIPGIRSADELAKVVKSVKSRLEGLPEPVMWVRVMYPSNLFFMESLAAASDVLALDLDSLARLMLGADDGWLAHTVPALEGALENAFGRKTGEFAIISEDMVSMPSMLEFLVRHGTEIICAGPDELHTVKHIIASVEKRMLLEQGRG